MLQFGFGMSSKVWLPPGELGVGVVETRKLEEVSHCGHVFEGYTGPPPGPLSFTSFWPL